MNEALHLKYRPATFDEVIGQDDVVGSLQSMIEDGAVQHAYLLEGPSGCGKTTLARIAARELGCDELNLIEIDAASNTGIDDMRKVSRKLFLRPLQGTNVAVIVDEVHGLSKQAFESLLKIVEEPPSHVYWFLCTTDPDRVPKAIRTRCAAYRLDEVDSDDIFDLLENVAEQEEVEVSKDVLHYLADEARGSPRQALVYFSMCSYADDVDGASRIIGAAAPADRELIEIMRDLVKGSLNWDRVCEFLRDNRSKDPESIRIQILAYMTSVLLNSKKKKRAQYCLYVMECFSQPCRRGEGIAPLALAFGELLMGD